MDVDQNTEALTQPGVDQLVGPVENLGPDAVFRSRAGVMMPADRDADVVESFGAHDPKVVGRVVAAPVLPGGCFQAIAQVGPALESSRGQMSRGGPAGDRLHVAQAVDSDRSGVDPDRDRPATGDVERGEERLVMPGPGVMRSFHGRDVGVTV